MGEMKRPTPVPKLLSIPSPSRPEPVHFASCNGRCFVCTEGASICIDVASRRVKACVHVLQTEPKHCPVALCPDAPRLCSRAAKLYRYSRRQRIRSFRGLGLILAWPCHRRKRDTPTLETRLRFVLYMQHSSQLQLSLHVFFRFPLCLRFGMVSSFG